MSAAATGDPPFAARAEIEAAQLEQLRSLLAELFPANRFYTQKLQAAGVTFDVASLADFRARFPFTTKAELVEDQAHHPPFGTNLTWPLERYTRFHQTSGTRGAPLRWLDTPESWEWMLENWMEVFRAAGVGAGDRVCFAFSFGPFIGFWLAFESAERLGCLCLPAGGLSTTARLRLMAETRANVLCCTPTYALHMAEVAAREGLDLRQLPLKCLLVAGEPGGSVPAVRARLQAAWPGARVFDHHGMTEVGPVTFECPKRPGVLHVLEPAFLAEIVDPNTGRAVAPGQPGELVLTPLGRTGSPLLRYRTGDLVRAEVRSAQPDAPPCACGRHTLALEGGILGRTDDMLIVRGVNVYPSAVDDLVRRFGEVAEYQVCVSTGRALTELSVTIEPMPGCADVSRLMARVAEEFKNVFGLRVHVQAVPPGSLPRFEHKARRWLIKPQADVPPAPSPRA
ncbi:MAG: AMP-binding protein [Verrucomicrobiae bacterium]|nr:AMP-binding protein [Verrucomicrobiae bacterium]